MTIHVQEFAEVAVLPREELQQLLELARRSEQIELQIEDESPSTQELMRLSASGGSFDFWHEAGEDIYSHEDGEPV